MLSSIGGEPDRLCRRSDEGTEGNQGRRIGLLVRFFLYMGARSIDIHGLELNSGCSLRVPNRSEGQDRCVGAAGSRAWCRAYGVGKPSATLLCVLLKRACDPCRLIQM